MHARQFESENGIAADSMDEWTDEQWSRFSGFLAEKVLGISMEEGPQVITEEDTGPRTVRSIFLPEKEANPNRTHAKVILNFMNISAGVPKKSTVGANKGQNLEQTRFNRWYVKATPSHEN